MAFECEVVFGILRVDVLDGDASLHASQCETSWLILLVVENRDASMLILQRRLHLLEFLQWIRIRRQSKGRWEMILRLVQGFSTMTTFRHQQYVNWPQLMWCMASVKNHLLLSATTINVLLLSMFQAVYQYASPSFKFSITVCPHSNAYRSIYPTAFVRTSETTFQPIFMIVIPWHWDWDYDYKQWQDHFVSHLPAVDSPNGKW